MEMQMEYIRKLPEPQELMEQFPIDDEAKAVKRKRDEAIKKYLVGKGRPLSAHHRPLFGRQ